MTRLRSYQNVTKNMVKLHDMRHTKHVALVMCDISFSSVVIQLDSKGPTMMGQLLLTRASKSLTRDQAF